MFVLCPISLSTSTSYLHVGTENPKTLFWAVTHHPELKFGNRTAPPHHDHLPRYAHASHASYPEVVAARGAHGNIHEYLCSNTPRKSGAVLYRDWNAPLTRQACIHSIFFIAYAFDKYAIGKVIKILTSSAVSSPTVQLMVLHQIMQTLATSFGNHSLNSIMLNSCAEIADLHV